MSVARKGDEVLMLSWDGMVYTGCCGGSRFACVRFQFSSKRKFIKLLGSG